MRLVIYLFFGIYFVACSSQDESVGNLSRENLPDQESWGTTIIITKEGKKRAVVRAGHLAKYSNQQKVILDKDVDADFFSIEEKHMSNLKSEKAFVFESTDNLSAIGNVVVVSDSGVTLYTDSLYWDNQEGRVTTDDTIMLTTESMDTLFGIGFESNVDLTHWKILHPWGVRGR